jgi:hypothetical protein
MIKKQAIANIFFLVALCYIISPWVFEKKLFFNELLSLFGLCILAYNRFKIERSNLVLYIFLLIALGSVHLLTSLWRMDTFYYYLRNSVIVYSIFSFFLGYFTFRYLPKFIMRLRWLLTLYIGFFLLVPVSRFLFERFGMSVLFPALFYKRNLRYGLLMLIVLCYIYSVVYSSATVLLLFLFYGILLIIPGYKSMKQLGFFVLMSFVIFFILMQPKLALISTYNGDNSYGAIYAVTESSKILALDPNTTWRLVFWRQVFIDNFPANIPGLGFGTPLFRYFPVDEIEKLDTLPYVMGAHNSFFYLFARLGLLYVLVFLGMYRLIFKEYFFNKRYYYYSGGILLFWSFFAITVIASFNPVLESPVYASAYWLILGFLAKAIAERKQTKINQ